MNKSQAAIEFLVTYGWAILIVLVAIGALAYFGALDFEQYLPQNTTTTTINETSDEIPITTPVIWIIAAIVMVLGIILMVLYQRNKE